MYFLKFVISNEFLHKTRLHRLYDVVFPVPYVGHNFRRPYWIYFHGSIFEFCLYPLIFHSAKFHAFTIKLSIILISTGLYRVLNKLKILRTLYFLVKHH